VERIKSASSPTRRAAAAERSAKIVRVRDNLRPHISLHSPSKGGLSAHYGIRNAVSTSKQLDPIQSKENMSEYGTLGYETNDNSTLLNKNLSATGGLGGS